MHVPERQKRPTTMLFLCLSDHIVIMLTFSLRQTAAVKSKKKHYVNLLGTDN